MSPLHTIRAFVSRALLGLAPATRDRISLGRKLTHHCRGDLRLDRMTIAVREQSHRTAKRHRVDVKLGRSRIQLSCDGALIRQNPEEIYYRMAGLLPVVAGQPSLRGVRLTADISDGEDSGAGVMSFCSRDPAAVLIPDHIFVRTRGYAQERALAPRRITPWEERSDQIVWRGSTTGVGLITKPELAADDADLIPRVRLCLALKGIAGTDVKLSGVAQSRDKSLDQARLAEAGLLGDFMSPMVWYGFKFAIDIDGNSNAWSNLFTRLLMGCCVLKVASATGYRQWYYEDLKPWTHYVPVRADLGDLQDIIGWCRAHPAACRQIAAEGEAFAMARDFDTEIAAARERVRRAYADHPGRTGSVKG
jgi:hypothetical protein